MIKRAEKFDVFIGNEKLQYVTNYMYLGVTLDNLFTFEIHAKECCRQVAHKNVVLSKIRRYINVDQAITILKSMVLPYFRYGDVFLSPYSTEKSIRVG